MPKIADIFNVIPRKHNKSLDKGWIKKEKDFRNQVLKRDRYECRLCYSQYKLNVHHIKPKRDYPELIYNINNGITLCKICHSRISHHEYDYVRIFKGIIKGDDHAEEY